MDLFQHTACLVLGAIANHLKTTEPVYSKRIVRKMEKWLLKESGMFKLTNI